MPTFELQHGDKTFEIDAPDMQTAVKALSGLSGSNASSPAGPSVPLSGWSPGQVAELQSRQPPTQSLGDKISGAFSLANEDPFRAIFGAVGKAGERTGFLENGEEQGAKFGTALGQSLGPLGTEFAPMGLPASKPVPPSLAPAPQIAEDASKIGVELPKAVVGGDLTQSIGQRLADMPWVGTPLKNASTRAIDQLDTAATKTQSGYGSGSIPSAGEAARTGIETHIKGVSQAAVGTEYDKALDMMDAGGFQLGVPLEKTAQVAQDIAARSRASALPESGAVKFVREALSRGGMTYQGIKGLRTRIGEMLNTGVLPADMAGGELKQIYGALTEDLGSAVKASGNKEAFAQWQKANNLAATTARNNERLSAVLGAKNDEGLIDRVHAAASSSSRADVKLLALARRAVDGKTWDELASAVLSRMGRDREGSFSPDRFLTAWGKLSDAGKRALFRSTGKEGLADNLDRIARVSSKFAQMQRMRNTSNTAVAGSVMATMALAWANPLLALKTVVGGRVLSHMLAAPARAKEVSTFMERAYGAIRSGNRDAFNRATISLARAIAAETKTPQLIPQIAKELQGAQPGYADQQQQD